MSSARWIVITTINPPGRAIELVSVLCRNEGWRAVVIGDTRTPPDWNADGIDYLDVAAQRDQFGELADFIPLRHYSRKNLGFLYAIEKGADVILEMDDDNIPYESFGREIAVEVPAGSRVLKGAEWANVYRHFLEPDSLPIWPRGLPLDEIHTYGRVEPLKESTRCPIQQYLADNDPDVDAIYRLLYHQPVRFDPEAAPVVLGDGVWVPFNAQNTAFFAEAFPLLYLPCHVSFRMTDIWRSFVALAALSVHRLSVSFHRATVEQVRNAHNLMRDFEDEVPGYLQNREIGRRLREAAAVLTPEQGIAATALALWKALRDGGVIPPSEWPILEMWFERLRALTMQQTEGNN
jgi:hypothetical protein